MEPKKILWQLQETEQEIFKKEKQLQNIPSVAAYQEKKSALQELAETLSRKEDQRRSVQKDLSRKEMHLLSLSGSLDEARKKLYSGEVPSVKELESLEKKVQVMQREKQQLEDAILNLMESQEGLEEELSRMHHRYREEEDEMKRARSRAKKDFEQVQQELQELKARKVGLEGNVEGDLLARYREMSRGGRRCISPVRNNFCGICNVSLPSSFRAYLFNPGKQVYCENCGSMLVLMEDES